MTMASIPQIWNQNQAQLLPLVLGSGSPQFITQVSLSIFGFFPSRNFVKGKNGKIGAKQKKRKSFVKGVVCPVKIKGSFDLQPYQNSPSIFYCQINK